MTICFDTADEFIKPSYLVEYGGYQIEIKKGSTTEGHNLYIETAGDKHKEAHETGRRFLSELAWLFDTRVEILTSGGGGYKIPFNVANTTFSRVQNVINLDDYEQVAFTRDQQLALGIYREGISSNSIFYKFLSYFRVLNMKCSGRKAHIRWINNNIHKFRNSYTVNTINELKKEGIADFGEHFYISGRCAIAHASLQSDMPIADADSYDDYVRISRELPVAKALAEIFISEELNLPDWFQAFKITLLKKFRALFGEHIVNVVVSDVIALPYSIFPRIPKISFRLYDKSREFYSLSGLNFRVKSYGKGSVTISNSSQDWPLHTELIIDFIKQEIRFDVLQVRFNEEHYKFNEKFLIDYYYFLKEYFLNGRLEIWNEEDKSLMVRLWEFIPVNIDPSRTADSIQEKIDFLEGQHAARYSS